MKVYRLFSFILLLAAQCFMFNVQASEPINVTGFLVDGAVINNLINNGADGIKIWAGSDASGNMYYIITGTDAAFNPIAGAQIYRQNYKGDCPPSCDFMPTGLAAGGAYVDQATGVSMVDNYMNSRPGMANCVMINKATLDKLRNTYPYMKITFGTTVTVTGLKSDGTTNKGGTVTDAANGSCACTM